MNKNRRAFLIGASALAGTASLVGYKETLHAALTMKHYGKHTKDPIYTNSLNAEFDKEFLPNEDFSLNQAMCNGCTTHCGVRVKVDKKTQNVVRIFGNPYNPLSTDPWIKYETPLIDSFKVLSKSDFRSTVCARGNIIFDKEHDDLRVLKPLKRVGKRGENKWKEIEIEQLIDEITKGGDLFGEGEVEGLASIRDTKTPIDPKDPEKGPKTNGLCIIGTGDDGRKAFMQERFQKSFGTKNYQGHTAICGLSMRAGEAAYLSDFKKYPHLKPDFENTKYLLTFGTAPAQAGNPFKRQANLLVKSRLKGDAKCVAVAPMLMNSDNISIGDKSEWIPIIPGTDLAFVTALLQIIIDEKRYNEKYLSMPSQEAQKEFKDASFTNATHLVIVEGEGKNGFLKDEKIPLVIDSEDGILKRANEVKQAKLEVDEEVEFGEKTYKVKSSFTILKEGVNEKSLDFLSKNCGISVKTMYEVAREFTSYGRMASVDCHGGTMHTTGFYTTYAIMMLGAMVGNLNYKGGMSKGGGKYKDMVGAKYNLAGYKGKFKPQGYRVDKTRVKYEKTKEFKELKEAGKKPYPAFDMFYPLTNAIESDIFTNSASGYPYKLKAVISWNANFIYGQSGGHHIEKLLKEPKTAVPLLIAIDPFINESSRYADYIVPDSLIYDSWANAGAWAGTQTKMNIFSYPIKEQKQAKFKNGEPICMDSFMIELGKKLNLPGFGKNAIKGNDGQMHSFDKPSDFYLRVFENIALDGEGVPDISDEELKLANLQGYEEELKRVCGENWRKTAYCMARGGRYEDKSESYKGEKLKYPLKNPISIYNESLAKNKNTLTGQNYSGVPKFFPAQLNNGTELEKVFPKEKYPLLAFSYKSNVLSQCDASSDGMGRVRFSTYLDLNPKTAQKFNIKHGDFAKVSSENGEIIGMVRFRHGVHPESLGIEHGLGRDAEGAEDVKIGDKLIKGKIQRKSGVNINKLGLLDTSRKLATLSDFVCGSNARQAIPVSIVKL